MRAVFRKIVTHGISALSLFLFTATGLDCLAQPLGAGQASNCCKHAPCKKSPGQPPHSSCKIQPSGPEGLALSQSLDWSPETVLPVAVQRPDPPRSERVISRWMTKHLPTDSPPDLFLRNSSFLI
jgi:hypothetical protein